MFGGVVTCVLFPGRLGPDHRGGGQDGAGCDGHTGGEEGGARGALRGQLGGGARAGGGEEVVMVVADGTVTLLEMWFLDHRSDVYTSCTGL